MLVKDLDGGVSNWQLTGNMAKGKVDNRSSLHLTARRLLSENFPTLQILEEVPIKIRRGQTLYLDFYLPLKQACFEIHGEQHFRFVPFYHCTMLNFLHAQKRDREKEEWCEINNVKHIVLGYNEDESAWSEKIKNV